MTFLEVMAVLVILLFMGCLMAANFGRRPRNGYRINCVSNLKQIGLAMRMWANDHEGKLPWQVSMFATGTLASGTLELAESADVYRHFLALTNELSSPKVLACYADASVTRIADWSKLRNQNLSYLAGLDATDGNPHAILSGDRNVGGGVPITNRVMRFTAGTPAAWGPDLHKHQGNLGLADGSAQQFVNDRSLRTQIQSALLGSSAESLRLSIPVPQ